MKTLILMGLLALSFNSFAMQTHDVDCAALDESRLNQKANLSESTEEVVKEVKSVKK